MCGVVMNEEKSIQQTIIKKTVKPMARNTRDGNH